MSHKEHIPYHQAAMSEAEVREAAQMFYEHMNTRRSIRQFSDKPVDIEVVRDIVRTAGTAPSGAHKQPWTFCIVSDPEIKKSIRVAAEKEEYENYHGRMSQEWLDDLKTFETDWHKEFLETAPHLIVAFKKPYDLIDGEKRKNYYVNESVGIACGILIAAIHNAGLVTLTHTPSPMNFLEKILNRPKNERAYLLLPVGYPSSDAQVPDIERKPLGQISQEY